MTEQFKFSEQFPASKVVRLPEHYKKDRLLGILPNEMVYPMVGSAIEVDFKTGLMFVDTHCAVDKHDHDPPTYLATRVGIMRIHERIDGEIFDGFIADCRRIPQGEMYIANLVADDDAEEWEKHVKKEKMEKRGLTPLLAVVFYDYDQQPDFRGDEKLKSKMLELMANTEEVLIKTGYIETTPDIPDVEPVDQPEQVLQREQSLKKSEE